MKKLICIIVLSVSLFCARAQPADFRADNVWPLGYNHNALDVEFVNLSFTDTGLVVTPKLSGLSTETTNAAICNKEGELLMFTNGMRITYSNGVFIDNGDSLCILPINYTDFFSSPSLDFYITLPEGAILIPKPGSHDKFYLFHEESYVEPLTYEYFVMRLNLTEIQIDTLTDDAWVVSKHASILEDTLQSGYIEVCRHGNGRDWWMFISEHEKASFYRFLITPEGVTQLSSLTQSTDPQYGQFCFSPDGKKYIRGIAKTGSFESGLLIFDFDRNNGVFTNEIFINMPETVWFQGTAISPNSRFLYAWNADTIWQFDLYEENIENSREIVAIYDGFVSPWLPTRFTLGQLGPDGKIYILAFSTDRLHVINYPDKKGVACDVRQHSIELPTLNVSLPNFPNYRLGPLDGSTADTLGINNIPVAGWRHDTLPELTVEFTDNSYYDVQHWAWTFGDGGIDSIEHPVHTYAAPGYYYVCQTVSNSNAADTLCKWVQVGMGSDTIVYSTVGEYGVQIGLRIYPNPTIDFIFIQGEQAIPSGHSLVLSDALGREVIRTSLSAMLTSIDVRGLASGLYFYNITAPDGRITQAGKVMKL